MMMLSMLLLLLRRAWCCCGGGAAKWDEIVALDISPPYPGPPPSNLLDPTLVLAWLTPRDPMFVVQATKKKAN